MKMRFLQALDLPLEVKEFTQAKPINQDYQAFITTIHDEREYQTILEGKLPEDYVVRFIEMALGFLNAMENANVVY